MSTQRRGCYAGRARGTLANRCRALLGDGSGSRRHEQATVRLKACAALLAVCVLAHCGSPRERTVSYRAVLGQEHGIGAPVSANSAVTESMAGVAARTQPGGGPIVAGLPLGGARTEVQRIFAQAGQEPAHQNPSEDLYVRPAVDLESAGYTTVYYVHDRLALISIRLCEDVPFEQQKRCFYRLRDQLTDAHGPPVDDHWEVHPDYQGAYEDVAFKNGKARAEAVWRSERLEIQLQLFTNRAGNIYLVLRYGDPGLWSHAHQQEQYGPTASPHSFPVR